VTLLDRLLECDAHDLEAYTPLYVGGERIGWVRPDRVTDLLARPEAFDVEQGGLSLRPSFAGYAARTEALHEVLEDWRAEGALPNWWDERCPVVPAWGAEPLFEIERAGLDPLGLPSFGVHCNGYVRDGDQVWVWVAQRALDKGTFPGLLDHLAAGGQPLGIGRRANMAKECAEEADVPPALSAGLVEAGAIRYRCALPDGLNDDVIFCYDLELPADFVPRNTDGEVERFMLLPIDGVLDRLRMGRRFKFNVGPVILDFALRHGLLPRDDPEYDDVAAQLARMRAPR
jgi:hypothetical protein